MRSRRHTGRMQSVSAPKVIQVGDVAGVAGALTRALNGRADVRAIPVPLVGAEWTGWRKALAAFPRLVALLRIAVRVRGLRADVVHVHWLPNAPVGMLSGRPWVLHLHGSDIRALSWPRKPVYHWLLRRAHAVVYSTADLAADVLPLRPDAIRLPTPIFVPDLTESPRWDVFFAARSHPVKGASLAFGALRRIHEMRPDLRLAAIDGPAFEESAGIERLPIGDKATFWSRLAASRVVIGQLELGELGIAELEALALGRPVVMPTTRDAPVVQAATSEDVANAVLGLVDGKLEPPDGRVWVRERHDPKRVGTTLIRIYQRLIDAAVAP